MTIAATATRIATAKNNQAQEKDRRIFVLRSFLLLELKNPAPELNFKTTLPLLALFPKRHRVRFFHSRNTDISC